MSQIKKRKGKIKMWITIVIAIIGAAGLIAVLADAPGRNEIRDLTFTNVNFKNLKDGTYVGEFKGTKSHLRDTKVELTVSKGVISNVKILKGALDKEGKPVKLKGGHSIEELLNNAVTEQTLEVDVISGATVTSKLYTSKHRKSIPTKSSPNLQVFQGLILLSSIWPQSKQTEN